MTIKEYIQDRLLLIIGITIIMIALSFFLVFSGTYVGIVTIINIVGFISFAIFIVFDFLKRKHKVEELESIMDNLSKKYLFFECMPKSKTHEERKIENILRKSSKAMIEKIAETERNQRDYQEYVENWVHEIKVPITAIQLICENNKSDSTRKIQTQLGMIDSHVERSLYYARLGHVEKDFIIQKVQLCEVVKLSLAKYRMMFMQNDIGIELGELDVSVYADSKWIIFILGQIFYNGIKYKKEVSKFKIDSENLSTQVKLKIWDNGIGIPQAEIKRVFDKGFTGSNGRIRGGSTGMGLYLCQKLAKEMGLHMEVTSEEMQYTEMSICFPK